MTCLFRLLYKVPLIVLFLVAGVLITAFVFPLLQAGRPQAQAWNKCNRLKLLWLQGFSRIVNLKIEVTGEPVSGAALVVSNHISWLDVIALGKIMPGYFIAKNEILHWPVIGFIVRRCGTVFIHRGNKQAVRGSAEQTVWRLQQQSKVFVFPEGTTTSGMQVLPFHSSLFQPALLTRSAVQPIAVQYQNSAQAIAPFIGDDTFVKHLLTVLALDEVRLQLEILPPLEITGKSRQKLALESHAAIVAAIVRQPQGEVQAA